MPYVYPVVVMIELSSNLVATGGTCRWGTYDEGDTKLLTDR